jgi:hypothetical protein
MRDRHHVLHLMATSAVKTLRKNTGTLLAVALDTVAKQDGNETYLPPRIGQK